MSLLIKEGRGKIREGRELGIGPAGVGDGSLCLLQVGGR